MSKGKRYLRFCDLVALGLIRNRVTLRNWVRDRGFPAGRLVGPNMRLWDEGEVDAWIATRPVAPKPTPKPKRRPGRPRKQREQAVQS